MKIIGHRGAKGLAPENTLKSIEKALGYRVDGVEFDVRVTGDGIPVLHHDPYLVDASDNRLAIAKTRLSELLEHKPDLALLADVFGLINHRTRMIIEVKPGVSADPVIEVVKAKLSSGWKSEEMTFTSFDFKLLSRLHEAVPEIETQVAELWSGLRAHYRMQKLGSKKLSMYQKYLWWGFIIKFRNSDYQLYAFTINDPAKAKHWARYGLSGIFTDYPDRFTK